MKEKYEILLVKSDNNNKNRFDLSNVIKTYDSNIVPMVNDIIMIDENTTDYTMFKVTLRFFHASNNGKAIIIGEIV